MNIEILYAVNTDDNTRTNLLATAEGKNPGLKSTWKIIKDKLSFDESDEELYDKLGDIIEGFSDEYGIYQFKWETDIPLFL